MVTTSWKPRLVWMVLSLMLCGCEENVVLDPVVPNPLMDIDRFCYLKDGNPIPNDLTLRQGEYFYAFMELTPKKDRPTTFAGEEVSDPRLWGCIVVCFPEGKSAASKSSLKYPFGPYHRDQDPRYQLVSLVLAPNIKHMNRKTTQFIGTPRCLPLQSEENFAHWTFFGSPFDKPGKYIYEIQVFPSYHRISLARHHFGKPMVLRRGKLTILPANSPSS